ncbi:unnamed protein product, partial [Discosporangium mesarthrocarpum]
MGRLPWITTSILLALRTSMGQVSPVTVNLQPCIFAKAEVIKDVSSVGEAYITSQWYKGFWGASAVISVSPTGSLDLVNDLNEGKCNAIYVGIVPTAEQKTELQDYSRNFGVRIVYFDNADTANDFEVQQRLKVSQFFAPPVFSPENPIAPGIKMTVAGDARVGITRNGMQTNPRLRNIFTRPVQQWNNVFVNGTCTILAEYADEAGAPLLSNFVLPSASLVEWIGDDGLEELHVFFSVAWFDMGSWAWTHYINEWATRGVFQGERRFYLGPVVDDLFLATNQFVFDGGDNLGPEDRLTGAELEQLAAAQASINSQYNSDVVVEFAHNAQGILEKVNSDYLPVFTDPDAGLLPKGVKVQGEGVPPVVARNYLEEALPGMVAEFQSGLWASDDLLTSVLGASKNDFFWQSHTFNHFSRDNLGASDCRIEDQGNVEVARLMNFYFDNPNYNWRSMTSPGITGLYNKFCLESGANQQMKCYPGDNTYTGITTSVSLVAENEYHPLTTTVETNGYAGSVIVPRYATFIYFNCVTPQCLVDENEWIRRVVCGCSNLDPSDPDHGTCTLCDGDIQSFGSLEALMDFEREATSRQILSGRRDKYMFHQVNAIPTSITGVSGGGIKSLLQYWIEQMMEVLTTFISTKFPVQTLKFDDLCENFVRHEAMDGAAPLLKATKQNGKVTAVSLTSATNGYIPFTIPKGSTVSFDSSIVNGGSVNYGDDTTFYLATDAGAIPPILGAPLPEELPSVFDVVTPSPVPSVQPVVAPSVAPVSPPSVAPAVLPSVAPASLPSVAPVVPPSVAPVNLPSVAPVGPPSVAPVNLPSVAPVGPPSVAPVNLPS